MSPDRFLVGCGTEKGRREILDRLRSADDHLVAEVVKSKDPLVVLKHELHLNNDEEVLRALRNQNGDVFAALASRMAVKIGTIYEDVTAEVLGSIGVWQWIVVIATTMITVPSMINQYEDMFLLDSTKEVTCIPPERYEVVGNSLCTVMSTSNATDQLACSKWHVKLLWLIWLKKTWYVFCDNKVKLLSTTIISCMGRMFGCVIFGVIADSFGRRRAIIINIFAQLVLGITLTFCDSRAWFQLLVFLKSLFGGALIYMGVIISCEISSNGWRTCLSIVASLPRVLGFVCMVPIANATPNLESHSFMVAMYGALLIVILRWIPESPQWLLYNRKMYVAEEIIFNAAKRNAVILCDEFKIRPINQRAYNCLDETRAYISIFTTYNVRVMILVTVLLWTAFSFQWSFLYAKVYSSYAKQTLTTTLCIFVIFGFITLIVAKKILLKNMLLFYILLSGITATGEKLLRHTTIPQLFASIALAAGLIVYTLLLNISCRVFATTIRATLLGCCHAVGQLGVIVGYLVFMFQPLSTIASIAVDIAMTLLMATLCLVVVDVDGRELPDTIDDMDYFSELSKPLRWVSQKTNSPSHEEVEMRTYSFGSAGQSYSADRSPPQRIGFIKFWRNLVRNTRFIFPGASK